MPFIDSSDPALWDGGPSSLYRAYGENGMLRGYSREAKQQYYGHDIAALVKALNLSGSPKIALIGAGFGWGAEDMAALLPQAMIIAVDTSTWIQNNKAAQATLTILNADMSTTTGRRAIKTALGGQNITIDYAITEDILPILTDGESQQADTVLHQFATNVVHWVSVGVRRFDNPAVWTGDSRLNWKTLADWKALLPNSLLVQRVAATVL